jgi:hypothetical protein
MATTEKGLVLARKLAPALGYTVQISTICSLICRNMATWRRLALRASYCHPAHRHPRLGTDPSGRPHRCNGCAGRQQLRIEKRLETLVTSLPETICGPWRLDLTRGPRGNGLLLPPDGCTCVRSDDRHGRGVVIP